MKQLEKAYQWLLLAPAFLPLFYVQGTMYPMLAPKTLAFRAIGLIALALLTYLSFAGKRLHWDRLKDWYSWIPVALLVVAYMSSFFGADFYHSFWSTFERGDGLLTLSICIGYFYLILLSARQEWLSHLLKITAWVGSIAAIYLIVQWFEVVTGVDLPFTVLPNGRVGGTMGNAAFAAAYLGMSLFATLAAALGHVSPLKRRFLYCGATLQIIAVFLTATRGTILALGFIFVVWLIWLALGRNHTKCARGGLVLIVITAGLFIAFRDQLAQSSFEPIRRTASISLTDPTVASRLFTWKNVSREAVSHALLGYGAENINIPFNKIYDPSVMTEEWFDRTHNAYLDYFVQFGVFGAILYLALIASLALMGLRVFRNGDLLGIAVLGITFVYALQNLFVFDTSVTSWFFFAVLAGTLVLVRGASDSDVRTSGAKLSMRTAGAVSAVAILIAIYPVSITPWRANKLAFEAYLYQVIDVPRANAASKSALALHTYADLELGYNAYFMYTENQLPRLSGEDLRLAYENAVTLLETSFRRYPYDARSAVYLAQVLVSSPPNSSLDKGLLSESLARAIEESPKRVQPWYILANLSIEKANDNPAWSPERAAGYSAAEDILRRYTELVPGLSEPHFVLAQLAFAQGETLEASREAMLGDKFFKSGDLKAAKRAVVYYESVQDLANAAYFLREILRLEPENTNAQADLSQIESYQAAEPI